MAEKICRILALDGGGAKGFYTLGVLRQIEGLVGCRLHERFDLVFGTSTGAIIAALLVLGHSVEEIHQLYKSHVPQIMKQRNRGGRSRALSELSTEVFKDTTFTDVKTGVGIVTTRWLTERPMIFKGSVQQAHGRVGTFVPGFGCTIGDAVQASCSAYPYFDRKFVTTSADERIELMDGGFCANNPTLYAIADATGPMNFARENIRVVSVGVGEYPPVKLKPTKAAWWLSRIKEFEIVQKTLNVNTQSMEQLRIILFGNIPTVRINDAYSHPDMATDLLEYNLNKLDILRQRGSDSYALHEGKLKEFLC